MDELRDLIKQRSNRKPKKSKVDARGRSPVAAKNSNTQRALEDENHTDVLHGVTIAWMCHAFGKHRDKVNALLTDLKPIRIEGRSKVYDFKQAVGRVATPYAGIEQHIKTIGVKDLPDRVRSSYWDAKIKELKYKVEAKELWHTDDVVEAFSDLFKIVKMSTQLWVQTVENSLDIPEEQVSILQAQVDSLTNDIYLAVVRHTEEKTDGNAYSSEIEDIRLLARDPKIDSGDDPTA